MNPIHAVLKFFAMLNGRSTRTIKTVLQCVGLLLIAATAQAQNGFDSCTYDDWGNRVCENSSGGGDSSGSAGSINYTVVVDTLVITGSFTPSSAQYYLNSWMSFTGNTGYSLQSVETMSTGTRATATSATTPQEKIIKAIKTSASLCKKSLREL